MTESEEVVDLRALRTQMRAYDGPTRSVSHRMTIEASPHAVYETLLDGQKLADVTGQPAKIPAKVGGQLSLGGGRATGYLTEVLPDRHVVFALQTADARWPKDYYSTATFMLRPEGRGTHLTFFQQGVPEELADEVAAEWERTYWEKFQSISS